MNAATRDRIIAGLEKQRNASQEIAFAIDDLANALLIIQLRPETLTDAGAESAFQRIMERLVTARHRLLGALTLPHRPTDAEGWEAAGPDDDPAAHLSGRMDLCIAGLPMHVSAYAVHDVNGEQRIAHPDYASEWQGMGLLDLTRFQTTEINGREYVIVATPHGD